MSYLLDNELDAYDDWTSYFDWMIVGSCKPAFFTAGEPFIEQRRKPNGNGGNGNGGNGNIGKPVTEPLKGRIYAGGNQMGLQRALGVRPDEILYVGDHIYGDIVRSKKTSGWRTVLIVEELERELRVRADHHVALQEIRQLSELWELLTEEVSDQRYMQRGIKLLDVEAILADYHARGEPLSLAQAEALLDRIRAQTKERLDRLRTHEEEIATALRKRSTQVDRAFNRYWGSVFAERYDSSFFGSQLENYACMYTSRVSNFLFVSPNRYFHAPHGSMPHWFLP